MVHYGPAWTEELQNVGLYPSLFPAKSPSSNVTYMFVLVWVSLVILNTVCVYHALQSVTDNRLLVWEIALSSMRIQYSVLQYSTTRGIHSHFLTFSACFPLIYGTFLGYFDFNTPVTVGLRGDKPLVADAWYLSGCVQFGTAPKICWVGAGPWSFLLHAFYLHMESTIRTSHLVWLSSFG